MLVNALFVVTKVLVRDFYQKYATLFLIVGGIGIGFIRGQDHLMLGRLLVQSPILLLAPYLLWVVYSLLAWRANHECLQRQENEFLRSLRTVPYTIQFLILAGSQLVQLLPILIYAFFLINLAIEQKQSMALLSLSIATPLFIFTNIVLMRWAILSMIKQKSWRIVKWINERITRPAPLFFIEWIFRQQFFSMMAVKSVSVLLLMGVLKLYLTDSYDVRLVGMVVALCGGLHLNFVYEAHRFWNFYFSFLRSLPVGIVRQQCMLLTSFFVLLLPEVCMLLQHYIIGISVFDILTCVLFLFSNVLFFDGWLYVRERNDDEQLKFIFYFVLIQIVLILFYVPTAVLVIINLLMGTFLKRKFYYDFQYTEKK